MTDVKINETLRTKLLMLAEEPTATILDVVNGIPDDLTGRECRIDRIENTDQTRVIYDAIVELILLCVNRPKGSVELTLNRLGFDRQINQAIFQCLDRLRTNDAFMANNFDGIDVYRDTSFDVQPIVKYSEEGTHADEFIIKMSLHTRDATEHVKHTHVSYDLANFLHFRQQIKDLTGFIDKSYGSRR